MDSGAGGTWKETFNETTTTGDERLAFSDPRCLNLLLIAARPGVDAEEEGNAS